MMFHLFKKPAALATCLVIASAYASNATPQGDGIKTSAPIASAVDLDLLALLATQASASGTTLAHTAPARALTGNATTSLIVPATSATYQRNAPVQLDAGTGYGSTLLPIVSEDSDLLEGTVYGSDAAPVTHRPIVTPGTYRTIEYK